jgi:hypothetical protein
LSLITAFVIAKNGKNAIATISGTQQPSHDNGVAAQALKMSIIADIGTQITITKNASMYITLQIRFNTVFYLRAKA